MAAPPHETAALAEALGGRVSAETLFGIGGGTGFGWFTYGDHSTLLTRLTTHETATQSFLLDICERLGLDARLVAASGSAALGKKMRAALDAGDSVVVCVGGPAVSYSAVLLRAVTDELLERAAAVPGAARNRFLAVRTRQPSHAAIDRAMQAGLRAHLQQMREGFGPPSARGSFGLAGFTKWKKSAPALDERARTALRDQIEGRGGGAALREAQAAFLDEAGLKAAAKLTREAALAWAAAARAPTASRIEEIEAVERAALETVEAGMAPAS